MQSAPSEADYSADLSESIASDGSNEEETGSSTTSTHNLSVKSNSTRIDAAFIQREERLVRKARYVLALTTLACATAISVTVYYLTKQTNFEHFEFEVCLAKSNSDAFSRSAHDMFLFAV
jgi:hypothetical protein